ncbi:MAG: histidine-type phosphatase, partial [archaeon]|nr:histidine-type phosphatase [archaeon]
ENKKEESEDLIEYDDHIEYKGQKMFKPFVEKPINGDDHNIYIYYPPSHGGGHKRLFRKCKNLCSLFIPGVNKIRRDKSYIYEEFMQTDGFDIKVYTIGPEYAHAEARKSPSLDGIVERSSEGKEVRYPVNLTLEEKEISKKIVKLFKQNICGFDILRANGKSYVCDVNGWSFVKGNNKYYEDCAILLRQTILRKLNYDLYVQKPIFIKNVKIYKNLKLPSNINDNVQKDEELRSVVSIFRHADRSPKQKMKLVVENEEEILSLFDKYSHQEIEQIQGKDGIETIVHFSEIKLKKPNELTEILNIVTNILERNKDTDKLLFESNDNKFLPKLFQVKMVLEKNLNFEGMTRKIQFKPLKVSSKVDPKDSSKTIYYVSKALMILKWGGNITHAGIEQAKLLGNTFRVNLYPSGDTNGLLRLHSTYRHDLKCYSAEEGRCLKTAAAFLQGFLQLEGPMIPIISSMVRKDKNISQALDISCDQIPEVKSKIKSEISECLNQNEQLFDKFHSIFKKEELIEELNPIEDPNELLAAKTEDSSKLKLKFSRLGSMDKEYKEEDIDQGCLDENGETYVFDKTKSPLDNVMLQIGNPKKRMFKILDLMDKVIEHIKTFLTKEECETEVNSYFIKSTTSIQKRSEGDYPISVSCFKAEPFEESDVENYMGIPNSPRPDEQNATPNIEIIKNKTDKSKESISVITNIEKCPSGETSTKGEKSKPQNSPGKRSGKNSETSSLLGNEVGGSKIVRDCEDERIILIVKRYMKLRMDFYDTKKDTFDISKVPDIYDNIKYDIIHNRLWLNEDAITLYVNINLLATFVMPLEYGITTKEKLDIGFKIVGRLFSKIQNDLIWWDKYPTVKKEMDQSEVSYSGLDQSRAGEQVKNTWRRVKTRFYFTCASHMYSLFNLLRFGYNSFLIDKKGSNKKSLEELKGVFDLDYCSHIVFRLFENFNVDEKEDKRFRLEIIMSPGSNKNPTGANKNHMINVAPWIVLNNNLTLEQMKEFFSTFSLQD